MLPAEFPGRRKDLKGIKDASTIVAINQNGNAPIFKIAITVLSAIHGDSSAATEALGTEPKEPAPPMVKMKRPRPPKPEPIGGLTSARGYE